MACVYGTGEVCPNQVKVFTCKSTKIITVAIFAFINSWNEFLAALIIVTDESKFTLPVMLTGVRAEASGGVGAAAIDWGALQAGVTVNIIPCLILFLLLQRYYMQGLMGGAVK